MKKLFNDIKRNPAPLFVGMVAMFILGIVPGTNKIIAQAGDALSNMIPLPGFKKTGA